MGRNTGETELTWNHFVMMDLHFKTLPRLKRRILTRKWQCWLLSRPQGNTKKESDFPRHWQQSYPWVRIPWPRHHRQDLWKSTSSSHSSHCVQHFSPCSTSSSPPAQLSSREKLVSPNAEDHIAPKHQTIIWPQDVNTQLTSGLAALVQETSPLAPYKIQHSTKRKARQAFSNMC